jgi:hypothetical protein
VGAKCKGNAAGIDEGEGVAMKGGVRGRKADQIIVALLEHSSLEKAAAALGVTDVTIWRWLQKPDFQEAYRQARREAFSRSVARLQQAAGAAVSTLLKVMVDKDAPASSRVRAADSVLDHAATALELEDLEVRLRRIEELEKNKKGCTAD